MLLRTIAAVAAAASLAACQQWPGIAERTVAYNRSIASSTNDLFLLNILRARERQPTYYTRNQSDTTTASATPQLSIAIPGAEGFSRAIQATTNSGAINGAAGFASTVQTTNSFSKAVNAFTPSLSVTQSDQLGLQNLDDKESMNGLMTPVSVRQMNNYLTEGYNREQVYLMYLDSISLSRSVLKMLPYAAAEYCGMKAQTAAAGQGEAEGKNRLAPQGLACKFFFQDTSVAYYPIPAGHHLAGGPAAGGSIVSYKNLAGFNWACFGWTAPQDLSSYPPSKVLSRTVKLPPNSDVVTFSNDPAVDPGPPTDMGSFTCFKQVLLTLLALDLQPAEDSPRALYRLPVELVERNPRYFSDVTQQGLELAVLYDNDGKATDVGVCKEPSDMVLSIGGDGYVKALFSDGKMGPRVRMLKGAGGPLNSLPLRLSQSPYALALRDDSYQHGGGGTSGQPKLSDCAKAVKAWQSDDDSSGESLTLAYVPRSLEGMVYFLGQVLRRVELGVTTPDEKEVTFLNEDSGGRYYQEILFHATNGPWTADSVARAYLAQGGFYYVPPLCGLGVPDTPESDGGKHGCTVEYPNHSSAQMLTMLNQIWGLNKTQTAAPVIPTVTVIGH